MNIINVLGDVVNITFGIVKLIGYLTLTILGVKEKKSEKLVDKWMK